ncbi:MAG: hypothetical protein GY930_21315 [bacterium]|nr:hypothetical protein [bacterium]
MSTSSNNLLRVFGLTITLLGLWYALGKANAPSEDNYLENAALPQTDLVPIDAEAAGPVDSPEPEDPPPGTAEQVTAIDPAHALNEQNQEAIQALKEERFREAEELFRKCHEADPEEPVFTANLAEALARKAIAEFDSKPEDSFDALVEAIDLAPDRADLKGLEQRWLKILEAQAGYAEDQSQHFVLQYDGDKGELLSNGYLAVLQDLEAAYQDYGEFFDIFPVEDGRPKFAVVLYDRDVFDSVTGIGEWAGGAFDGTIRIPVRNFKRDHARIRGVLRHELVHAFIQELGGKKVPGWLNEGLAQYLSPEGDGQRALEVQSALRRLKGKAPLPWTKLAGTLASLTDAATIRIAYDQSMGLTHWIAFHYGERTLVSMVTGCKQGKPPGTSFQDQIHIPLSAASQDFVDSL